LVANALVDGWGKGERYPKVGWVGGWGKVERYPKARGEAEAIVEQPVAARDRRAVLA